jgi:hypothetical protein
MSDAACDEGTPAEVAIGAAAPADEFAVSVLAISLGAGAALGLVEGAAGDSVASALTRAADGGLEAL